MRINKTKLEQEYLKKIIDIRNEYLKKEKNSLYDSGYYCLDEEELHRAMDEVLVNLLKDLGYQEIVKQYEKTQEYFWYS